MNEICGEHAGRGAKTYANRNFPATRSDISVWKKFQRDVKPAALQRSNLRGTDAVSETEEHGLDFDVSGLHEFQSLVV